MIATSDLHVMNSRALVSEDCPLFKMIYRTLYVAILVMLPAVMIPITQSSNIKCQSWGDTMKCALGSPGNLTTIEDDLVSELEFSDCNLRFVDPQWLEKFPNLVKVHLNGNGIDCSCFARKKFQAYHDAGVVLIGHCEFPEDMHGTLLWDVTECTSEEDRRKKRSSVEVDQIQKMFHRIPPMQADLFVGKSITLDCSAVPPYSVQWSKNDHELNSTARLYSTDRQLIIDHAQHNDSGQYQCTVDADEQGLFTVETNVTVLSKPYTTIGQRAMFPTMGTDLMISCYVIGMPVPTVQWVKNGIPLLHGYAGVIMLQSNRKLLLKNIMTPQDDGMYECRASNKFGSSKSAVEVRVVQAVAPHLLTPLQDHTTAYISSRVLFCCSNDGNPAPQVSWTLDNQIIYFDRNHSLLPNNCIVLRRVGFQDAGMYRCLAENVAGSVSHQFRLDVVDPKNSRISLDDFNLLRKLGLRSRNNVTLNTVHQLLKHHAPQSIDGFANWLEFGDEEVRRLEDAERVFKIVLLAVRDKLENVTTTKKYPGEAEDMRPDTNPNSSISALHIHRLAEMSGCFPHQLIPRNCSGKCLAYRTADGTCNNLKRKMWGASQVPLDRWLPAEYENGFNTPKGWNDGAKYHDHVLPSPRRVSTLLISGRLVEPDPAYTHMAMQWGQFVDHDFTHTLQATGTHAVDTHLFSDARVCVSSCTKEAPCFPIRVPDDDPRKTARGNCIEFVRSTDVCLTGETSFIGKKPIQRQQFNQITSYIDASNVYGSTEQELHDLREQSFGKGLLRMKLDHRFPKRLLPFAVDTPVDCQRDRDVRARPVGCFLAGDHRASEQVALIAMHTIWARQHNRLAVGLSTLNPQWSGEQVFQEARKIVAAQMQIITYRDWLPLIIGKQLPTYRGYRPSVRAQTANVIATAAFRFGHTMISPIIYRLNESLQPISHGNLLLRDAFFSPWRILEEGGIDPLLRGMFGVPAKLKTSENILNHELTEQLFHIIREISLDLAALNIQRGRDHGLPSYVKWRQFCNLSVPKTFDDLRNDGGISNPSFIEHLAELYGDVRNVDVWAGGVLEDNVLSARVGPLFQCLIGKQFELLRDGDRFWHASKGQFDKKQLAELLKTSLAKIICENADGIHRIPEHVFLSSRFPHDYRPCSSLPDVDLSPWAGCCRMNVMKANKVCNSASIFDYNPLPVPSPY